MTGLLLATGLLAASGPARAAAPREACKADVEKLCADAQGGKGGIGKCLRDNSEKLSEECREAIASKRGGRGERGEKRRPGGKPEGGRGEGASACKADADRFCKGVQPGQGRILECLKSHEAELSASCKAHVQ